MVMDDMTAKLRILWSPMRTRPIAVTARIASPWRQAIQRHINLEQFSEPQALFESLDCGCSERWKTRTWPRHHHCVWRLSVSGDGGRNFVFMKDNATWSQRVWIFVSDYSRYSCQVYVYWCHWLADDFHHLLLNPTPSTRSQPESPIPSKNE